MLAQCCKRFRWSAEALPDQCGVECHFCGTAQEVFRSQRNSFFCTACEQYNGFRADGDYNVDRPELSVEELNQASLAARGVFETRNNEDLLCDRCQAKQLEWLTRGGRDRGDSSFLCADCAFAVREALRETRNAVKMGYLGKTIAASRQALVSMRPVAQSLWIRILLFLLLIFALALSSASSLAESRPELWFLSFDVFGASFLVLVAGLNRMLAGADGEGWNARFLDVASVGLGVTMWWSPLNVRWRMGAVVAAWLLLAAALFARLEQAIREYRRQETIQRPFRQLAVEPAIHVASSDGAGEEEELEDPFQLGLVDRGWSNRPAAFVYQRGERDETPAVGGRLRPLSPSADELVVESLFQRVALSGENNAESPPQLFKASRGGQRLNMTRKHWQQVWQSAPRATVGMVLLAAVTRLMFWNRQWSIFVYLIFLALAAGALFYEPVRLRRYAVGILGMLAISAVFPWSDALRFVSANFEVLILFAIAVSVILMRNTKAL